MSVHPGRVSPAPPAPGSARAGARGDTVFRVVMAVVYAASIAGVLWLAIDGRSYYMTPVGDRPHHPEFRDLSPGGFRGHGVGILGSVMLLTLLLYSVRKRSRRLARFGSTAKWLRVHMYFGIFGPLLITLHSSFKVTGLVAVSYWSMVAVALSGIFGRFLYREIPRTILGQALTSRELEEELRRLDGVLGQSYGLDPAALRALDRIGGGEAPDERSRQGIGATFRFLFLSNLSIRRRSWALAGQLGTRLSLEPARKRELFRVLHERALLHRRSMLLTRVQELFHWWHVIHRPFAYVMLIIMFVHIGVALAFGYDWIF